MRRLIAIVAVFPGIFAADLAAAQPTRPTTGTSTTAKQFVAPPFYLGKVKHAPSDPTILPVTVDPTAPGLPTEWVPVEALTELALEISGWLAREASAPLMLGWTAASGSVGPQVYFGCSFELSSGECATAERENVLARTTASKGWKNQLRTALRERPHDYVFMLEIGLAPQWIQQKNVKGSKEIRLGSGYTQPLPWLSSLDTPIWVLQLRGAAVNSEGAVERFGVEGLWALRTPFSKSAAGGQMILSPDDVEQVRVSLRRDDLPGNPLVWQVATHQLIQQLGGSVPGATD